MLFAERHGKLGRDGSLAHDRAEDLLTSTAFQLLRYLPPHDGLFAVLRRTRAVRWNGSQSIVEHEPSQWLTTALNQTTSYELEFWPHWGTGVGQPDLVISLRCGERKIGRIVVEVKLDSGKSQLSELESEEGESETEPRNQDQLSRYSQELCNRSTKGEPALGLIYLTAHSVPPIEDLTDSLRSQPGIRLVWLSWLEVWDEMDAAGKTYLPARDLSGILAAKGLSGFTGFHAKLRTPPAEPWNFWMPPVSACPVDRGQKLSHYRGAR